MDLDYLHHANEIAINVARDEAQEIDSGNGGSWVEKTISALKEAKLTGLTIPQSMGGLGGGLSGLVKVCEILGKESGSAGLSFGMHCVGSAVIAAKATKYQQENILTSICEGKHITTLSVSEPGTGAHFYFPQTTLELENSNYVLNGEKAFITSGNRADSYVVSTKAADPDAPPDMFSCIIVPQATDGMEWKGKWEGIGMKGNASIGLLLNNVKVPKEYLIGEEGDQMWYIFNVIAPYFLLAMAGTYLGIATRAVDEAIKHVSGRIYAHSGSRLDSQAVVQHKMGKLWRRVESCRRLIYYAAEQGDIGEEKALPAILSAKAEVADCVTKVVNESMTLCGGIAYRENGVFSRLLRDSRAADVMSPTTDLLDMWLGRALLSQPILGE